MNSYELAHYEFVSIFRCLEVKAIFGEVTGVCGVVMAVLNLMEGQ